MSKSCYKWCFLFKKHKPNPSNIDSTGDINVSPTHLPNINVNIPHDASIDSCCTDVSCEKQTGLPNIKVEPTSSINIIKENTPVTDSVDTWDVVDSNEYFNTVKGTII